MAVELVNSKSYEHSKKYYIETNRHLSNYKLQFICTEEICLIPAQCIRELYHLLRL